MGGDLLILKEIFRFFWILSTFKVNFWSQYLMDERETRMLSEEWHLLA